MGGIEWEEVGMDGKFALCRVRMAVSGWDVPGWTAPFQTLGPSSAVKLVTVSGVAISYRAKGLKDNLEGT
jgi:hypothetical protein